MKAIQPLISNFFASLRALLTPWVFLGACGVATLLLAGLVLILVYTRPAPKPFNAPTAVMAIIPAPTATPILPTPTPAPTPTPTEVVPTLQPGVLAVGALVQVTGTGSDGLRLRSDAGLEGETMFVGVEAEVFQVQDGPRQVDGYTWWYLISPSAEARRGWAVANYLAVIQNP